MKQITNPDIAQSIVTTAIKHGAIDTTDERDVIVIANDVIRLCIEAWKKNGVRPDNKDPEISEAGKAVAEILDIAGIDLTTMEDK